MTASAEVLGTVAFDPELFRQKIEQITVKDNNGLVFQLKNGTTVEKTWVARSRSESWTPEKRQAMREKRSRTLCLEQ